MIGEKAAKLLWDAHGAAQRIARFIAGRSFDDYLGDDMLRAAVERQFEIIGEAFAGLSRIDPTPAAGIPDLPRIVAFRNVLIHACATVDPTLVWGVIENHLPALRAALAQLLGNAPEAQ
jgi:uncharacterized protein with HEPN domain